ncbi:MAG: hypothetical protein HC927_00785 [Deltaproteobacteria bacterium]|nr:hypothetical protein [Deltaproteobacteria bacterium]
MSWLDLLFAHWSCAPATIRALVPAALELDTFEGRAYVAVVPFRMENVGRAGFPGCRVSRPSPSSTCGPTWSTRASPACGSSASTPPACSPSAALASAFTCLIIARS